jgi:hypothetical protein
MGNCAHYDKLKNLLIMLLTMFNSQGLAFEGHCVWASLQNPYWGSFCIKK